MNSRITKFKGIIFILLINILMVLNYSCTEEDLIKPQAKKVKSKLINDKYEEEPSKPRDPTGYNNP